MNDEAGIYTRRPAPSNATVLFLWKPRGYDVCVEGLLPNLVAVFSDES